MGTFVQLKVDLFALLNKRLPTFYLPLKTPGDKNKTTKMDNHVSAILNLYSDEMGKTVYHIPQL